MTVANTRKGLDYREDGGERVLSPEQVAERLGIGRTFVYKLLAEKRIPSFTIGKLRRVRQEDVDRYIQERLSVEADRRGL